MWGIRAVARSLCQWPMLLLDRLQLRVARRPQAVDRREQRCQPRYRHQYVKAREEPRLRRTDRHVAVAHCRPGCSILRVQSEGDGRSCWWREEEEGAGQELSKRRPSEGQSGMVITGGGGDEAVVERRPEVELRHERDKNGRTHELQKPARHTSHVERGWGPRHWSASSMCVCVHWTVVVLP